MAIGIGGQSNTRIALGDIEIGKASIGDVLVYSSGSVVTYHVDTDTVYTEEVDSGASVLTPSSFKPSKSGYTFVGWREDTAANGSVLSSKTMGSDPITLYAVFSRVVTANFYSGNNKTHNKVTGNAYYNASGQTSDAIMTTPTGAGIDGWIWLGWSYWWTETANENVWQGNGATFNVAPANDGITFYGLYRNTFTETFIDWDGSTNNHYYTHAAVYYNSAGNTAYSNVTAPSAADWSGWSFQGWSYPGDTGFNVNVSAGQTYTSTMNCVRYAIYATTITLSYNGNGASGGSVAAQYGTAYCNISNNYSWPTFTLAANGFSRTNKNFVAWAIGSTGGTQYAPGNTVTLSSSTTFYAVWRQVYTPYTIGAFKNYNWTWSSGTGAATEQEVRNNELYMLVERTGGSSVSRQYSATLPTQGCNRMRVKYTSYETYDGEYAFICGTHINSEGRDAYLYFNISEDATSIDFVAGIWTNALEKEVELYVKEIYFYYE